MPSFIVEDRWGMARSLGNLGWMVAGLMWILFQNTPWSVTSLYPKTWGQQILTYKEGKLREYGIYNHHVARFWLLFNDLVLCSVWLVPWTCLYLLGRSRTQVTLTLEGSKDHDRRSAVHNSIVQKTREKTNGSSQTIFLSSLPEMALLQASGARNHEYHHRRHARKHMRIAWRRPCP